MAFLKHEAKMNPTLENDFCYLSAQLSLCAFMMNAYNGSIISWQSNASPFRPETGAIAAIALRVGILHDGEYWRINHPTPASPTFNSVTF